MDDDIEGSFDRPKTIDVSIAGREYGPTAGIKPLRVAIANLYNAHHRKGKSSQYRYVATHLSWKSNFLYALIVYLLDGISSQKFRKY